MGRREFTGRSAAEAAIKACEELGTSRSQLKYDIVSDTGAGLERRVVIGVDADQAAAAPAQDQDYNREESHREPRDEQPDRDRPPRSDGDRGGGGDRGGRGARGGGDRGGRSFGGRGGGDRGDRGGRGGGRGRDGGQSRGPHRPRTNENEADGGIDALLNLETAPTEPVVARPALETEASSTGKRGADVLAEVLKLMSMQVAAVRVDDGEEEVQFDLRGADEQRIIGKKGDGLLALQFIVNRMISREDTAEKRVVLDAAGYRERRRAALADLAKRLAARAMQEHKVVRLSPMSAHDRRIFHITLQDTAGVSTRSEGNGLYRKLLIIPAEAEQQS